MSGLKMLNSTKYLYKLTFIKCSYEPVVILLSSSLRAMKFVLLPDGLPTGIGSGADCRRKLATQVRVCVSDKTENRLFFGSW